MDDYSEIVDFTKISDSKVDETHSDSHCKFSRHIIDVFGDNYKQWFQVYIWYRDCHCLPNRRYVNRYLNWNDILRGPFNGLVVHGNRHCRIHRHTIRNEQFGEHWSFREECHCNTR